jgi:hypothetical protein
MPPLATMRGGENGKISLPVYFLSIKKYQPINEPSVIRCVHSPIRLFPSEKSYFVHKFGKD